MKKVLVIKGRSAYNVLRKAADEIAEGFDAAGCETEVLDTQAEDFLIRLNGCMEHREQYAFCFSLQAIGWEQECTALPQLRDMRRVGWLVDDPFFHEARLIGSVGTGAYVLTVQDAFTQRIREMYPKFEMIETLYHGGFASEQVPRWEDREIDVFFPGSYTSRETVWEKLKKIDGIMGSVAQKVALRLIQNGQTRTWDEELRCYLDEIQFEMSEDEFQTLLREFYPLDEFQRVCMREQMLETLLKAGRRMSVVGKGWNSYQGEGVENLEILAEEGVNITEVVKYMQHSKIVLHNINFVTGLHERIFTAMLAGAVCVTEKYELLEKFFEDGKEIVTYSSDEPQQLVAVINDLLSDPGRAAAIAAAGRRKALQKHTWKHRGEQIAKWMDDGLDFEY